MLDNFASVKFQLESNTRQTFSGDHFSVSIFIRVWMCGEVQRLRGQFFLEVCWRGGRIRQGNPHQSWRGLEKQERSVWVIWFLLWSWQLSGYTYENAINTEMVNPFLQIIEKTFSWGIFPNGREIGEYSPVLFTTPWFRLKRNNWFATHNDSIRPHVTLFLQFPRLLFVIRMDSDF